MKSLLKTKFSEEKESEAMKNGFRIGFDPRAH